MATPLLRTVGLLAAIVALAASVRGGIMVARGKETLAALELRAQQNASDFTAWNRIANAHLRLLVSTGDLAHLQTATKAVEQSLKADGVESNTAGLALQVRVQLASHEFNEAKANAQKLASILPKQAHPLGLLGDACFNLGQYEECEAAWQQMATFDSSLLMIEPRLAQLDLLRGRNSDARARYEKVLERAKELEREMPEVMAWANVQLGELVFLAGDWDAAAKHYDAALAGQSNYYPALEHKAELLGAQGKLEEAAALYTRLIDSVRRPELMQELGDLYLFYGRKTDAVPWHAKALNAYLESASKGEAVFLHNLAALYADSLDDPGRALRWARQELTTRQSVQAYDALAWALYKSGSFAEARETILRVLTFDPKNSHLLYHAGTILLRAGDVAEGERRLRETVAVNPRYNTFHIHRG